MIKISDHKTLGAVCLAASLMMLNASQSQAAVGNKFIEGDLEYTVLTEDGSSGTVSVKLNNYSAQNVSIPSTVENGGITYTVTTIGEYAFQHAQMPTITIPDSVITIEYAAFAGCALQYITIPDSVITISNDAFYSCESMTNIVIGNNVKTIGNYAFEECEDLLSITIPDSVTDLGENTFYKCKSLKSAIIGDGVTIIGYGTFSGCRSLTEITIPNNVTEIDSSAFTSCRGLTNITLPNRLTSIGEYAFAECSSLPNITIPETVTTIGDHAFMGCEQLEQVYYKGDLPKVDSYPWSGIYGATPETLISYYPNDNASWKAAIVDGQWQTRGTAPWDPPSPATAKLSYDYQNSVLTLTFTGTLYQSANSVNWTKVESAVSPYQVKIEKEKLFFRARSES
ncbi:MAG: leucine-rich repeat domain-containing protein [Verrucomicrobia bacterium]|nr:leucine-rich repeat domain-containing protein [Verrucomicrobiota bacterium]